MAEIGEGKQLSISISSPGSLYTPAYTERTVKIYGITEAEFDQLSLLNSGTLLFFAIGGSFVGLMAEGLYPWLVSASIERAAVIYTIVCGVVAAGCFGLGAVLLQMKRSLTAKIKTGSRPLAGPPLTTASAPDQRP